jgi:multiple sugar transport system ATP-binding protein
MAEVVLREVEKAYPGGVPAIRDFSLSVHPGELLVIMGPSGSGKTTVLRLIAGLDEPTQGTITFDGRLMNGVPPHRRDVAMVFQRPALYPHWSVGRNLAFGLRESRISNRLGDVIDLLGLERFLLRRPGQLSGGEQQRVALGRALARQPAVFLLDEPLSNLDATARNELRAEVHLLHERLGTTMIYVTHDPAEATALADRLAVLAHGALQQVGTPEELVERPVNRYVAATVAWPPPSFLDGRLVGTEHGLVFQGGDAVIVLPAQARQLQETCGNGPVILGLRPEALNLVAEADRTGLDMVVTRTERWGNSHLLGLQCGQWRLTVYDTLKRSIRTGERVRVALDLTRALFFDPATGRTLGRG